MGFNPSFADKKPFGHFIIGKNLGDHRIKILLIDDHVLVCNGLAMPVNSQPDMVVAGLGNSGAQALELLESGIEADLLITDLNLLIMKGFDLLAEINCDILS